MVDCGCYRKDFKSDLYPNMGKAKRKKSKHLLPGKK